jgi:DNA invertase Pin-like site-specific DNA recombinase
MLNRAASQKIRPDHLDRLAVIYVRQSTLFQVRENTGSTTRQYDLVKRAADLGWTQASIQVVDQDQGQSGSSTVGRDGFQWLVAEVGLGHVGAVLSLEVSRLARSCSDWYRLLEICALTATLVIDDEGVYDPGAHNDRLLLGFKGSMSEAELHWLKSRLQGGKMTKAEQGQLRFRLPIGAGLPIQWAGLCWTRMRPCRKLFVWSFRFLSNRPRPSPWSVPSPGNTCVSRRGGGAASEPMN